jgi:UDP-GlcNAc:undecaprenyl-phosphate/decaprenyl-phosphate GlcNAc-1-phosphate transferase
VANVIAFSSLVLYFVIFLEAAVISLVLTRFTIWLAPKIGFMDHPGHRKVHSKAKPVLGGLAIFAAFQIVLLGNLLLLRFSYSFDASGDGVIAQVVAMAQAHRAGVSYVKTELIGFLVAGWMVFILGLIDDRFGMPPIIKLLGQMLAGAILYFFGIQVDFLSNISPALSLLFTVLWVAGVANAYNWIDNMDGLCAGIAAVACFFFAMVSHQMESQIFMVAGFLTLCGACSGFLHYNLYPSKLFMGDSGSMFIGYNMAALSILATYSSPSMHDKALLAISVPIVILAIPLFDMATVIAIRIKRGKPIYLGDKNHISHRLVELGLDHHQAVLMIYLFCFCTGMGALVLHRLTLTLQLIVLLQVGIIFSIIILLERAKPRGQDS